MDRRSRAAALIALIAVAAVVLLVAGSLSRGTRAGEVGSEPTASPAETPTATRPSIERNGPQIGLLVPPTTTAVPSNPQPLLIDATTGLSLFYGGGDPLQRVDLDTGEFAVFGHRAMPQLSTGGELVLQTAAGRIGWVGLHDPGEMAEGWIPGQLGGVASPGELWVRDPGDGAWKRHQLVRPRMLERRAVPEGGRSPTPELLELGGMVFEWNGSWRALGTGQVITQPDGSFRLLTCADSIEDCSATELRDAHGRTEVVPPLATSPDGRFTATIDASGATVVIHDVITDQATVWRFPVMAEGGSLLFVESAGAPSGS